MFFLIRSLLIALVVACFAQAPTAGAQYVYQTERVVQNFYSSQTTADGLYVTVNVLDSQGTYTAISRETLTMGSLKNIFWQVDIRKWQCSELSCGYLPVFSRNGEKGITVSQDTITVDGDDVNISLKGSGGVKNFINDPREEVIVETECALVDETKSALIDFAGTLTYGGKSVAVSGRLTASKIVQSTWTARDSCYYYPDGEGKGEKGG